MERQSFNHKMAYVARMLNREFHQEFLNLVYTTVKRCGYKAFCKAANKLVHENNRYFSVSDIHILASQYMDAKILNGCGAIGCDQGRITGVMVNDPYQYQFSFICPNPNCQAGQKYKESGYPTMPDNGEWKQVTKFPM